MSAGDGDVTVIRVSARTGRITLMEPIEAVPDRLLTGPEVASLLGIGAATWRSYVRRGYAPKPDDDDSDGGRRHPNRREPRWRLDTIRTYRESRPGQGARTDLGANP